MSGSTVRYAVLSPVAAAWVLSCLRQAGVTPRRVHAEVVQRHRSGDGVRASAIADGWAQLQQAHRSLLDAGDGASVDGRAEAGADHDRAASLVETVTTTQAARELGVSSRRVRQLVDCGALPARKVGSSWLIDQDAVTAARDARRHLP